MDGKDIGARIGGMLLKPHQPPLSSEAGVQRLRFEPAGRASAGQLPANIMHVLSRMSLRAVHGPFRASGTRPAVYGG